MKKTITINQNLFFTYECRNCFMAFDKNNSKVIQPDNPSDDIEFGKQKIDNENLEDINTINKSEFEHYVEKINDFAKDKIETVMNENYKWEVQEKTNKKRADQAVKAIEASAVSAEIIDEENINVEEIYQHYVNILDKYKPDNINASSGEFEWLLSGKLNKTKVEHYNNSDFLKPYKLEMSGDSVKILKNNNEYGIFATGIVDIKAIQDSKGKAIGIMIIDGDWDISELYNWEKWGFRGAERWLLEKSIENKGELNVVLDDTDVVSPKYDKEDWQKMFNWEKEQASNEIEKLVEKLCNFDWLNTFEKCSIRYEEIENKINELKLKWLQDYIEMLNNWLAQLMIMKKQIVLNNAKQWVNSDMKSLMLEELNNEKIKCIKCLTECDVYDFVVNKYKGKEFYETKESLDYKINAIGKIIEELEWDRDYADRKLTEEETKVQVKLESNIEPKKENNISKESAYLTLLSNNELLTNLSTQIPEMNEKCKFAINLPAYREWKNIFKAIYEYTVKQKNEQDERLDPELFEINIFLNRPNSTIEFDKETEQEVERFKKKYPKYKVNLIKHTFNFDNWVVMWEIYKTMADLSVYRNIKRQDSNEKNNLILRNWWADAKEKNKYFLQHVMKQFDKNEDIAVYKSESRYPKEVLEKCPLLNIMYTLYSWLNRVYTKGKSNIGSWSYKSDIYASVWWFNWELCVREDIDLAARMRSYVWRNNLKIKKDLVKNAIDDPRRVIMTLYKWKGIESQYNNFGWDVEKELRDIDWQEKLLIEELPNTLILTKENLEKHLTSLYHFYLKKVMTQSNTIKKLQKVKWVTESSILDKTYEVTDKLFSRMFSVMGIKKDSYSLCRRTTSKNEKSNARIEISDLKQIEDLIKNKDFDNIYKNFNEINNTENEQYFNNLLDELELKNSEIIDLKEKFNRKSLKDRKLVRNLIEEITKLKKSSATKDEIISKILEELKDDKVD